MSSLVYVKNPNGKTYVYSNTSIYDKETKKVKHIRKSIGHLDSVTGEVVPNRRKGDAARKRAQTEEPAGRCVVKNTGIQSLLDKAVNRIFMKALYFRHCSTILCITGVQLLSMPSPGSHSNEAGLLKVALRQETGFQPQ